jgi:hypothetical protein
MSDTFIKSVIEGKRGQDIPLRYQHAREIRTRIDSQELLQRLERLASLLQQLGAVINVSLLNESTSVIGQIFAAVDRIVWQTADAFNTILGRVFEIAGRPEGCWSAVIDSVRRFETYAKSVEEHLRKNDVEDRNAFINTFAAYVAFTLGKDYRNSSYKLPGFIDDTVNMCDLKDKVKLASVLTLGDHRCDRTTFCSKFAGLQWTHAKYASEKIRTIIEGIANPEDLEVTGGFVGFVDWLQQLANGSVQVGLNKSTVQREIIGGLVLNGSNEIDSLFKNRAPSTFEVPNCCNDMEKWKDELEAWRIKESSYNVSADYFADLSINSQIKSIDTPNNILQWLTDHTIAFRLGNITLVGIQ